MNSNTQVFEYHGARRAEYYNQFFNPNICHVCKAVDKAQILKIKPQNDTRRYGSWQIWIVNRRIIMESAEETFGSPIEMYVKQMIMWSKTCVICYQQAKLRACQKCFSVNFCNEHAEAFRKEHDGNTCELLTLLLNINIETISGIMTDISYEFLSSVKRDTRVNEMLEFYMKCVLISRDDVNCLIKDYVLSDYLSGPLSIYYEFEKIYGDKNFNVLRQQLVVIHIIAANSVDRHGLPAWEVLLHLIPEMRELRIIMIGPELRTENYGHNICNDCQNKGKKMKFYPICMLYHDYIQTSKSHQIPDLIVGFEAKLDKTQTWSESIKVIRNCLCPLILGAKCQEEVDNDMLAIEHALNVIVEPIVNKNYFAAFAPHKDLMSNIIRFRNQYLSTYKNLVD
ncbi:uncharacterized protein LOC116843074 isoform X2 [Odontomachus brunneus]|uniref:uncharacterized protein LOC116843074 isoform X2 n=1 Tax=Odontomachus brunneus TaxID=486640 RepID=UPI0013F18E9E|nr:uncharacterized protein LOC116843074 isoform X2 [Odontomachus brunneus]